MAPTISGATSAGEATAGAAAVHPVDEVLPIPQMFLYGLQHVLSMYAGVVAMPLIVGPLGGEAGLRAIYGSLIVAGAIAFCLAPFFTRLLKLFPPVVTGVVITVIGVSLLPVAVRWASGTPNTPENTAGCATSASPARHC